MQGQILVWSDAHGIGTPDRSVGISGSQTHAYVAGRAENDAGTGFKLLQYKYAPGSGTSAILQSSETFPVYFGGGYEATCMTSLHLGEPITSTPFQYSQVVVAGSVPASNGKLVPAIASFETKLPCGSPCTGVGNLRLMWSVIATPGDDDATPIKAVIDGVHVAVLSKLGSNSDPAGFNVRVFKYSSGKQVLTQNYKVAEVVPAGVFLAGNYVVVGGSGRNGTGSLEMFAMAYALEADPSYNIVEGQQFGPDYVSSGSGRTFQATCMTSSENNQINFNGGNYFAIAGRSYADSTPANGDWFVQAWTYEVNLSTHVPSFIPQFSSVGKSTSTFDDQPVSMCLGLTPVNYGGEFVDPLPAYFRLWVSGNRVPLAGGKSQITTVQYYLGGSLEDIEWWDNFSIANRNVVAASIGAMDFTSGYDTRAYVGGYAESLISGYADDFLMLKYSSEPTFPSAPAHGQRANLWGPSGSTYPLSGKQQSVSIMPIHPASGTGFSQPRTIFITGFTSSNGDDMFSQRWTDQQ